MHMPVCDAIISTLVRNDDDKYIRCWELFTNMLYVRDINYQFLQRSRSVVMRAHGITKQDMRLSNIIGHSISYSSWQRFINRREPLKRELANLSLDDVELVLVADNAQETIKSNDLE